MENQWMKGIMSMLVLITLMTLFGIVMSYGAGGIENNNNFNRYDIKVITDPKTGCEYLIQDRNRVGELLPRYDDNGKIKGCKSE